MLSYFIKLGLKSNVNLSSSIIYQTNAFDPKQFKCYEFPKIEQSIYLDKSISQYEIPQYIQEIPEGFSIFCTLWEAGKVKKFMELSKEEQNKLGIGENEEKDKDDEELLEPIPRTNFCHLCRRKFDDYLIHIETMVHKNNITKNPMMINDAQNTFKRINNFWNTKNNNNNINNDETNEKNENNTTNNKLFGRSISSFSSAVSTYKFEENCIKDINCFLLDQELSETDKNNDKENQCENKNINKSINKNKKYNKKYKHTKNNSYFMTLKKSEKCLENKLCSHLSSSQSSLNLFINKKRKGKNISENGKNSSFIDEEKNEKENDYFPCLNAENSKKLIRGEIIFFK